MPAGGKTGGAGRARATTMGSWVDNGERQAVGRWVDSGEGAAGGGETVGRQRCRYVVVGGVAHSNEHSNEPLKLCQASFALPYHFLNEW